jgi:hypothetical protein
MTQTAATASPPRRNPQKTSVAVKDAVFVGSGVAVDGLVRTIVGVARTTTGVPICSKGGLVGDAVCTSTDAVV